MGAAELQSFKSAQRLPLSVLYVDLRPLAGQADRLDADILRQVIDRCLHPIASAISTQGGVIDTIDGNGVQAVFGVPRQAPDHAWRALVTALRLQHELKVLQDSARRLAIKERCGFGVVTDAMVATPVGSVQHRRYSVFGGGVALAQRLSSLSDSGAVWCSLHTVEAITNTLPPSWHSELLAEPTIALPPAVDRIAQDLQATRTKGAAPNWQQLTVIDDDQRRVDFVSIGSLQLDDERWVPIFVVCADADALAAAEKAEYCGCADESPGKDPIVARQLGRYRLLEIIGRGGMGEVWKALDPAGNYVAVKTLLTAHAKTKEFIDRFRREAEVMERLDHPSICPMVGFGEQDDVAFIAMEYIDGMSLAELLHLHGDSADNHPTTATQVPSEQTLPELVAEIRNGKDPSTEVRMAPTTVDARPQIAHSTMVMARQRILPIEQALGIITTVGQAVQHAHARGVLHRDLKPGNIMLGIDGRVMVMDFGLAKVQSQHSQGLSVTGQFLGTLAYMAPEQASSAKDVSERADVFALGAMLFEMLTGEPHFRATGNMTNDIHRLVDHEPPRADRVNDDVDEALGLVIHKAMAVRPTARYANVAQLLADIKRWRNGEPVLARSPSSFDKLLWKAQRHRGITLTIAASFLVFIIGAVWSAVAVNQKANDAFEAQAAAEEALAKYREEEERRVASEQAKAAIESEISGGWQLIYEDDFSDTASSVKRWDVSAEQLRNGRLYSADVGDGGNTAIFRQPIYGDIRLSFTVTVESGPLDDVSCTLNGDNSLMHGFRQRFAVVNSGYQFKYGGWQNTRSAILRYQDMLTEEKGSALAEGATYRVVAQRRDGTLQMWVDNQLVMEVADADPIAHHGNGIIVLSTWYASLAWDDVRIERWGLPQRVELSSYAQDLMDEGKYVAADEVIESAKNMAINMQEVDRLQQLSEQNKRYMALQGIVAQQNEVLDEAWPNNAARCQVIDGKIVLQVIDQSVTSLEPLQGMTIHELEVSGLGVSDLSPLRGMPLRKLYYVSSPAESLQPLAGMPLEELTVGSLASGDLSPLRGMPLEDISIGSSSVASLRATAWNAIAKSHYFTIAHSRPLSACGYGIT